MLHRLYAKASMATAHINSSLLATILLKQLLTFEVDSDTPADLYLWSSCSQGNIMAPIVNDKCQQISGTS